MEICYAGVQTVKEVFADPLFRQRGMVFEYTDKKGSERSSIGIPVKLSKTPGSLRTIPDEFGESTREILFETGYSREQIESFFSDGIV